MSWVSTPRRTGKTSWLARSAGPGWWVRARARISGIAPQARRQSHGCHCYLPHGGLRITLTCRVRSPGPGRRAAHRAARHRDRARHLALQDHRFQRHPGGPGRLAPGHRDPGRMAHLHRHAHTDPGGHHGRPDGPARRAPAWHGRAGADVRGIHEPVLVDRGRLGQRGAGRGPDRRQPGPDRPAAGQHGSDPRHRARLGPVRHRPHPRPGPDRHRLVARPCPAQLGGTADRGLPGPALHLRGHRAGARPGPPGLGLARRGLRGRGPGPGARTRGRLTRYLLTGRPPAAGQLYVTDLPASKSVLASSLGLAPEVGAVRARMAGTTNDAANAARVSAVATSKAREYPSLRAAACDTTCRPPARAARVRSVATVASTARPMEPPICRDVLSTPEASPASVTATLAVAAAASGVNSRPRASEMRHPGPNT